jgi:hypothetical protein
LSINSTATFSRHTHLRWLLQQNVSTNQNKHYRRINMADDARAAREAVTKGLMNPSSIRQLSSSGDAAKNRRAQLKKEREEREQVEKKKEEEATKESGETAE